MSKGPPDRVFSAAFGKVAGLCLRQALEQALSDTGELGFFLLQQTKPCAHRLADVLITPGGDSSLNQLILGFGQNDIACHHVSALLCWQYMPTDHINQHHAA